MQFLPPIAFSLVDLLPHNAPSKLHAPQINFSIFLTSVLCDMQCKISKQRPQACVLFCFLTFKYLKYDISHLRYITLAICNSSKTQVQYPALTIQSNHILFRFQAQVFQTKPSIMHTHYGFRFRTCVLDLYNGTKKWNYFHACAHHLNTSLSLIYNNSSRTHNMINIKLF